jgi:hypothetical protein
MNPNTNPATASAFSSRDHPCYDSDPNVAALNVLADDERSYQLPYAQFLYSLLTPNMAMENDADAAPEKLLIRFAVADVIVSGSGLKNIERLMQKYELKFVKSADRRYAGLHQNGPMISSITVTLREGV